MVLHDKCMSGIPYQEYVRESLRGVIPRVLRQVAAEGMIGDHSLYLTFSTKADGVHMPPSLRAQYPKVMTVVLQHQFEELEVSDVLFSVTLRFGGVPARLTIPYAAVSVFVDPSIDFAIQFDGSPSAITGRPPAQRVTAAPSRRTTPAKPNTNSTTSAHTDESSDNPSPDEPGKVVRVDFSKR